MPAERVAMRQVREIIRLKFSAGVGTREISRRIGISASTVRETLRRFEVAALSWPLPEEVTDSHLEAALYTNRGTKQGHRRHAEPDWTAVHRELKRKHVTLEILWDEYVACPIKPRSPSPRRVVTAADRPSSQANFPSTRGTK